MEQRTWRNHMGLHLEVFPSLLGGQKYEVFNGVYIAQGTKNNGRDIVVYVMDSTGRFFAPYNRDLIEHLYRVRRNLQPYKIEEYFDAVFDVGAGLEPGDPFRDTGLRRNLSFLSPTERMNTETCMTLARGLHALKWIFASEDLKYPGGKGRGLLLERICEIRSLSGSRVIGRLQVNEPRLSSDMWSGIDYSSVDHILAARKRYVTAAS